MSFKSINLLIHGPIISKKEDLVFNCTNILKSLFRFSTIFDFIVISTWENENTSELFNSLDKNNIFIIKNKMPSKKPFSSIDINPNKNMYLQAYSVLKGCEFLKKLEYDRRSKINITKESLVLKIRTDQEYPDYLGFFNFIKRTTFLNNDIYVKAFRPSVPFHITDQILISKLETMFKLFNFQYNDHQKYDNVHYDLFYSFLKVTTPKRIWTRAFFPSSNAIERVQLTPKQFGFVKKSWLNNIHLIPKRLLYPFSWRGNPHQPLEIDIYEDEKNPIKFKTIFTNLEKDLSIPKYSIIDNYSNRLVYLNSKNMIINKIGLIMQLIKKILINMFYCYLKCRRLVKKIFIRLEV